jgi:preprotein translocase subunit YajC
MFWLLAQTPLPSVSPSTTAKANPSSFLFLIGIFVVFYFLMIRPQKKRRADQMALLNQLDVGDEIETAAGMFGRITRVEPTTLTVQLAPGFEVRMSRGAVRRKIVPETIDPEG